jgi:hypothetical protein
MRIDNPLPVGTGRIGLRKTARGRAMAEGLQGSEKRNACYSSGFEQASGHGYRMNAFLLKNSF